MFDFPALKFEVKFFCRKVLTKNLHHALKMHYLKPETCIPQYEVRRFVQFYQIHIV